jgi:hypothetical protein
LKSRNAGSKKRNQVMYTFLQKIIKTEAENLCLQSRKVTTVTPRPPSPCEAASNLAT